RDSVLQPDHQGDRRRDRSRTAEGHAAGDARGRGRGGAGRRRGAGGSGCDGMTTAEISASLVKELRDRTGAGMMDCKGALQEANGDLEAAIVLLRERGMASAAKRAGRVTTEGLVGYRLADDGSKGTMVAIGCETEPVSKDDEFFAYVKQGLDAVDAKGVGQ